MFNSLNMHPALSLAVAEELERRVPTEYGVVTAFDGLSLPQQIPHFTGCLPALS